MHATIMIFFEEKVSRQPASQPANNQPAASSQPPASQPAASSQHNSTHSQSNN
jgi:hypothetical protein